MKKNKRHLYKRLPKYALGTMKPDMGYQQARGIGNVKFDTELNMSLEPETQAIRKSALPNALGYVAQQTPYITEAVKGWTPGTKTAGSVTTSGTTPLMTNTSLLPTQHATFVPTHVWDSAGVFSNTGSALSSGSSALQNAVSTIGNTTATTTGGVTSQVVGTMADKVAQTGGQLLSNSAQQAVDQAIEKSLSTSSTGSGVLGVAGKAMAGVGTALGAYTMANQIAGFGDHRNASDMLANVGRQHITTDMGNSYTNYNGVNAGQELAYEKANARSKQLGFGMNAIGTGASVGSFFGPIGTGIGAAAGLLLGGLGSLFGWGDNSDEIERLTKLTNDNIANYNRQQEAVAKSKDVAAEFSDRQGVATAATGKEAGGNMENGSNIDPNKIQPVFGIDGWSFGFPSSVGMSGELLTIGRGKNRKYTIIPSTGNKKDDNKDSIPLKDVKPGSPHTIVRKDLAKLTKDVLDGNYREDFKDWYVDQVEELQSEERYNKDMKKYKNGKLPGFWRGTDYLMSAIPHLAALGGSWNLYNRAKYADMPDYPNIVDSSANTLAIKLFGERKYNVDPILDNIHKNYRQYLYNVSHSGASAGQLAIERANAFIKKNEAQTQALTQADEINNKYTADYANALANYGKMMTEMMTNNNYARAAFRQQQNAAKEGWMAQYEKNGLTALADLASDIMGVRQFNRSEDYQNRMLELYNQQVKNDKDIAQATLANAMQARLDREAAYNKVVKETIENTHPMFLNAGMYRPDGLWNLWGNLNTPKLSVPGILRNPKYMKYAPIGYKDGKRGFVSRGSTLGQFYEEIQPDNLFGIGSDEYSTKMITDKGDTVYQTPSWLFSKDVVRKKGGPASKEYIKAKQRHNRLLKNATPSNNIGMDQLLRMFGF